MIKEKINLSKAEQGQSEMTAEREKIYEGGKRLVETISKKILTSWNRAGELAKEVGINVLISPQLIWEGAKEVGRSVRQDFWFSRGLDKAIAKLSETGGTIKEAIFSKRKKEELSQKTGVEKALNLVGRYAEGITTVAGEVKESADQSMARVVIEAEKKTSAVAQEAKKKLEKYGGSRVPKLEDILSGLDAIVKQRQEASIELSSAMKMWEPFIEAHKAKKRNELKTTEQLINL